MRDTWSRRITAALAAVALGFSVTTAAMGGIGWTDATWTDSEQARATITAGHLNSPTAFSCASAGGLLAVSIEFTWTPSTTTGGGVAPDGYVLVATTGGNVQSYTIPGGATARGAISGGVLSLITSTTVSIYAYRGTWVSPVAVQTRTVTAVAGVLGIIVGWSCV